MIDLFLLGIPAWLLFLLLVFGLMSVAWWGTMLVRLRMKVPVDDAHNTVAGLIFAAVSVMYGVLLAFIVSEVWQQFEAAEQAMSQEATALIAVAHDTVLLPEPTRGQIHDQLRTYAEIVLNEELLPESQGKLEPTGSPRALVVLNQVWTLLPPTAAESDITTSLQNLSTQRTERLLSSDATLPGSLWVVLVAGAVITIGFCMVLHMKNVRLHAAMTALLANMIALCFWLILELNYPFIGDLRVSPEAFHYALQVINSLPR